MTEDFNTRTKEFFEKEIDDLIFTAGRKTVLDRVARYYPILYAVFSKKPIGASVLLGVYSSRAKAMAACRYQTKTWAERADSYEAKPLSNFGWQVVDNYRNDHVKIEFFFRDLELNKARY